MGMSIPLPIGNRRYRGDCIVGSIEYPVVRKIGRSRKINAEQLRSTSDPPGNEPEYPVQEKDDRDGHEIRYREK